QEIWFTAGVAGIHLRLNARRIEENQWSSLPIDHYLLERNGHRRTRPASLGATNARSQEHGHLHRLPGARPPRIHDQKRREGGENLWRLRSHSRPGRHLRAIQRSCGSTGTARVVAHFPAEAERNLPRSWRDRRLVAVARYHGKGIGMECAGRGVDAEGAGELG